MKTCVVCSAKLIALLRTIEDFAKDAVNELEKQKREKEEEMENGDNKSENR